MCRWEVSIDKVHACQSMVEACVHPTTKEIIPVYGRVASFIPANIPITAGKNRHCKTKKGKTHAVIF